LVEYNCSDLILAIIIHPHNKYSFGRILLRVLNNKLKLGYLFLALTISEQRQGNIRFYLSLCSKSRHFKMLLFSFWIFTYQELNDPMFAVHYKFPNISGYAVLVASLWPHRIQEI